MAAGAGDVAGQFDVLDHIQRGEQVEVLKDEADVACAQPGQVAVGGGGDVHAAHNHGAGGWAQ
jgi:hypothetical protein